MSHSVPKKSKILKFWRRWNWRFCTLLKKTLSVECAQKAAKKFYGMQKVPHKRFHRATGCGWKFRMSSDEPAFAIGIWCCAAWMPRPRNDGVLVLLGNHIKNNFFVCHWIKEVSLSIILTIILDSIWCARSRNWLSGSKYNFYYFYCGVKGLCSSAIL